jgi:PTH2 family peptidyl-tRNA hydrolase
MWGGSSVGRAQFTFRFRQFSIIFILEKRFIMATTKQVIVMRTDLNMRKGKMAAQAAHASLGAILMLRTKWDTPNDMHLYVPEIVKEWFAHSFTKVVVGIDSEEALVELDTQLSFSGIIHKLIRDNGTTEFHGVPTYTCLAAGPDYSDVLDVFTGHLKLL